MNARKWIYEDFLSFCEKQSEENHNIFDPANIEHNELERTFTFQSFFRDADNFKDNVQITFHEDSGEIDYVADSDDALDELETLYHELIDEKDSAVQ